MILGKSAKIEFPESPIANEVTIEADRILVATKIRLVETIRFRVDSEGRRFSRDGDDPLPYQDPLYWEAHADMVEAEAKCYELGLHNRLFQLGMAIKAQRNMVATAQMVPPGGGRRM